MSATQNHRRQSRRKFIAGSAGGVALVGIVALAQRKGWFGSGAGANAENPYAYDLSRFRKTDPNLIRYEETGRIERLREDPRKIAFGPDDQLYLAAGNYVCALELDGGCRKEIALDTPPRCLAVAEDGTLYVGLRDHIEVYDSKGKRRATWEAAGKRSWFTGLALGKDTLFVANAGHRVVLQYDRSGKLISRIGEKNPERNIPGFVLPSPYFDLEMHPDGLLRVANPGRHRVEAYTLEGDFELAWGRASAALDGFCGCCNPINLALLPDGRCVTCEKGLPRVKVYEIDGSLESVVAGPEAFAGDGRELTVKSSAYEEGILDAAVDSGNRIFILDSVADNIRIMTRKTEADSGQPVSPV